MNIHAAAVATVRCCLSREKGAFLLASSRRMEKLSWNLVILWSPL